MQKLQRRQRPVGQARPPGRARVLLVVLFAGLPLVLARQVVAAPSAGCAVTATADVVFRPPVASAVIDGFRMANGRYGAGNRGLEYRPGRSSPVGALADGVVVFAGPVAGQLHVTVCHADGRRSSYSYLESVAVGVGDRVAIGETVGLAGDRVHVGVRQGAEYVDPEPLFARGELRVRLIADASFGTSADDGRRPPIDTGLTLDSASLRVGLRASVGLGRLHR